MRSVPTVAYYEHKGVLYHLRHDGTTWFFTATTPDLSRSIAKGLCGAATRELAVARLKKFVGLA